MPSSLSHQCLGLVLLAAILLQTIAVAISFIYFNNVLTTMQETFSRSSVSCLMGTNLQTVNSLIDSEVGKDDPCWQVTQQLHYRIEKTMSNRLNEELSSVVKDKVSQVLPIMTLGDQSAPPRPEVAAHVTGNFMAKEDRAGTSPSSRVLGQKIQTWESQKGLAFLHNMEMSNGELVVPQSGLYYIYSQTYFRHTLLGQEEEDRAQANRSRQLLQYIYKKMSSYPVPILLMKNARSTCWSEDQEYGLYSIYQAGVAQLGAGDRVFVTVSNVSTVDMDERASFFGAFLVT